MPEDAYETTWGYRLEGTKFDGWTFDNGFSDTKVVNPVVDFIEDGYMGLVNPDGGYAIDMRGDSGRGGSRELSQTFNTLEVGATYIVNFEAANMTSRDAGIRLYHNGSQIGTAFPGPNQPVMQTYTYEFVATGSDRIAFGSDRAAYSSQGAVLDDVFIVKQ